MENHTEESNEMMELLKSELLQQQQQSPKLLILEGKERKQDEIAKQDQISNLEPLEIQPPGVLGTHGSSTSIIMLNQGFSNADDESKKLEHQVRHVHIPYILNGELYQIQTQEGENVTVKCCHCPPDRVYRGSVRSTGNFHMHIKRRHPDLLEKLHDMKVNALLERRDRLIRNRKVTSRNNRNRLNSGGINTSTPINREDLKLNHTSGSTPSSLDPSSELSMLHTHKLKIKTVFQRHQMQQREAEEMRNVNWNNGSDDYVVMPITKIPTASGSGGDNDGPINYSLKTQESIETHSTTCISPQNSTQRLPPPQVQQMDIAPLNTVHISPEKEHQQQNAQSTPFGCSHEYVYENQQNINSGELSTTATTSSTQSSISPSVMSTFSSVNTNNNHQMAIHPHPHIYPLRQQQTLSIVKPEELLSPIEHQAIDLTLNTDSGIFSNSNETLNNISDNNSTRDKRAGSQQQTFRSSNTPQTSGGENDGQKWQELLMHVETSLRDIQHEMNIRNQIESNRMFLDIAKFKFLHPSFQFNW
ncbi:stand still isoform X2 [Haematobia irritans]